MIPELPADSTKQRWFERRVDQVGGAWDYGYHFEEREPAARAPAHARGHEGRAEREAGGVIFLIFFKNIFLNMVT